MAKSVAAIKLVYKEIETSEIQGMVRSFGTKIKFSDDTWLLDKFRRGTERDSELRINFKSYCSKKHIDMLKYYFALMVSQNLGLKSTKNHLTSIKDFFLFLETTHGIEDLELINEAILSSYEEYLFELDILLANKNKKMHDVLNFLKTMDGYENQDLCHRHRNVLLHRDYGSRKVDSKYLDDHLTTQLDRIFKADLSTPTWLRLAYWLSRSIPSRITEVCSMKIECLKPSFSSDDEWVIYIPTWKTSGNYVDPEWRTIYLKNQGHGAYLINLIREQQTMAKELQLKIMERHKGYLFVAVGAKWKHGDGRAKCFAPGGAVVRSHFNKICEKHSVQDSNGELYVFTPHQLRHKGITDRVYEGFNLIEIRDMTAHKKNFSMIVNSYVHEDPSRMIEKQKGVSRILDGKPQSVGVVFKGRILNMNSPQEQQLLLNQRACRLGKIGICSDSSRCQKGNLFTCLDDCEFFIPDADQLEYFRQEVSTWQNKIAAFHNHQYMREHAEYNLQLFKKVVEKIECTILTQRGEL